MELYDIILNHEKEVFLAYRKELSKIMPLMEVKELFLYRIAHIETGVEADVSICRVLLDDAHRLGNTKLAEHDLDLLVMKLDILNQQHFSLDPTDSRVIPAKKEWIKAIVEFYQQLLQQEGKAYTYRQAIRQQFHDEASYRVALKPVIEAEERYSEAVGKIKQDMLEIFIVGLTSLKEAEVNYLFPKI